MAFDVLVINPNPLLNLVHAGEYKPGEVNRVAAMSMDAEGKGVNVARVLARLGHSVVVTGFAGGHSGAWLRDLVRAEGITDAFVETSSPLRVGFMAVGFDATHPTTVFPSGFPVSEGECEALLVRVEELLDSVRLVIASGSVPDSTAESVYADVLALCRRHSAPCWLDAYGPAMSLALSGPVAPGLSKPNREEYGECKNWERVEELHITDGGGEVEVRSRLEGDWRVFPPAIRQVNPVGSGDCYVAGLAHGWLLGLELPERLRYAVAAGTANAQKQGVAMIAPQDMIAMLDRVRLERL